MSTPLPLIGYRREILLFIAHHLKECQKEGKEEKVKRKFQILIYIETPFEIEKEVNEELERLKGEFLELLLIEIKQAKI